MEYDPNYVRNWYDTYGMKEWRRLDRDTEARVSFHIHQHYLLRYIKAGQRVLEIGPGPGRFTIELAHLGATVVAFDISPEQLRLNRERVNTEGVADKVEAWIEGDVTNLTCFDDASFDAVVCYGGPLSYVFDRADEAIKEMLRVTRPGGYVLLSVMSLLGTTRRFIPNIVELSFQYGLEAVDAVTCTGNLVGPVAQGHHCRMYRWSELEALLRTYPCSIVAASASGFLALQDPNTMQIVESRLDLWDTFLAWEVMFCQEPGALDGGTHIIAVAQRH